jgi:hypothetical protein
VDCQERIAIMPEKEIISNRKQKILKLYGELKVGMKMTLDRAIEIGKEMIELKKELPHGEFTKWIKDNLECTPETVRGWMRVYRKRGELEKTKITFGLTDALKFLQDKVMQEKIIEERKERIKRITERIKEKVANIPPERIEVIKERIADLRNDRKIKAEAAISKDIKFEPAISKDNVKIVNIYPPLKSTQQIEEEKKQKLEEREQKKNFNKIFPKIEKDNPDINVAALKVSEQLASINIAFLEILKNWDYVRPDIQKDLIGIISDLFGMIKRYKEETNKCKKKLLKT